MTKKKAVYVLVSDENDHYTEMAILSASCLRKFSPSLAIELVIDKKTFTGLSNYRKKILDLVDLVNVVDCLGENNAFTSRIIKTQLRKFVTGDYVYIDIDAVPVADISSVFECNTDLAMVYDHNVKKPKDFVFYDYERKTFDDMSWELPKEYFNSGVMFVKDSLRVTRFFEVWHNLWLQNSALGLHKDQPPMHEAIKKTKIDVEPLEPCWNLLIGLQKGICAKKPKIYHYSTIRFDSRSDTWFHQIVKDMKKNSTMDEKFLYEIISTKYPWTNKNSIRLNFAVGNYHRLPLLIFNKLF
ncbi:glycosyltransferase [Methylophaga sulfidovorans]|uniref:Glycosyl transferase family 8 n=1 Tax=Methylophaga sulfidovorans TaxID=45496 RepID=A0A1I3XMG5_9GAMM|nr:glycosyltransferase [Methylophaga sulfidovorans]SFK20720.1 Glycosyl transferase family 8 [Methylophaga sulfidovorans]